VGEEHLASQPLPDLLRTLKSRFDRDKGVMFQIFEDATGQQFDFDLRGKMSDVLDRALPAAEKQPGRGRPKMGVLAREVSLLPRHWEWLEQQPNGASAALRRLIDQERKREPERERRRRVAEATGRFMTAMAGNFPGYEEATRALYAGNFGRLDELIREWPVGIREHVRRLLE